MNKIENKTRKNSSIRAQAARNICDKGVIAGLALTMVSFLVGTVLAVSADFQHRKELKHKVNNG